MVKISIETPVEHRSSDMPYKASHRDLFKVQNVQKIWRTLEPTSQIPAGFKLDENVADDSVTSHDDSVISRDDSVISHDERVISRGA